MTALAGGGYALTWHGQAADGFFDIFTAVYGADGQPIGDTSVVNVSNTAGLEDFAPQVTALAGGGYALTWYELADGRYEIFTAVYGADGQPIGGTTVVNVSNTADLSEAVPQVTALAGGVYALTWHGQTAGGTFDIFTAVYGADGLPVGGTTVVNVSNTAGLHDIDPQVTALVGGGYALTWTELTADEKFDILTAVYGADGLPVGGTTVVNVSNTAGFDEVVPQVTALAGGGYALTWQGQLPGSYDIFTAVFGANGSNPLMAPVLSTSPTQPAATLIRK